MLKKIAIIVGSESDVQTLKRGVCLLEDFHVPYEFHILSAHRTPKKALVFAKQAKQRGFGVIIAAAGMSAHLAGVMAAHTLLPVIGIPLEGKLGGLDALLSTVQMPSGIPVGCVSIGETGAVNAALFAIQILAISDAGLEKKLKKYRKHLTQEVLKKDRRLQHQLLRSRKA